MFRQARIEGEPLRRDLQRQVDDARASEPERDAAMSLVLECWQLCGSARPRELVPVAKGWATISGEIPFDAIDRWAQRAGIDDDDMLLVAAVIRTLDADRTERIMNSLNTPG